MASLLLFEIGMNNKKIIWAVDPFSNDEEVLNSAAECLRKIVNKKSSKKIQPVYVFPSTRLDYISEEDLGYQSKVIKEAKEKLKLALKKLSIPRVQEFHLIHAKSSSSREQSRALVSYAKKTGAELIVVSSHGRKGVMRWMLGSFAESLILYSDVPLMIVNPLWQRTEELKTILFPTDFSKASKEAFYRVIRLASDNKSKIVLFYKQISESYPVFDATLSSYSFLDKNMKKEFESAKKSAKEYFEIAKKQGVRVNVVFDRSRNTSISEAILKQSKKLGGIIAMSSQSGSISAVMMGSVTRQVVRYSRQPVWVIHA